MNRFKITKIGLLNFWLYDEEEYDFYGGNLILRGTNGSGKSVTMQSFIPLILDGNKSPDRLDPFGSKERKIEDYILGDSESIQKEESTAYLYMETFNEEKNKYITIGLGFRGRKGKPTESWGFALKGGRRIGKDFYLYKDASNKIPLTKSELKGRLDDIDECTETMKDYKAMVNRLLFGFPNVDLYDEFIKLLLQLRSNKLSKDYKPTNLIDVLNKVLQPLSEDDLRPLSEAIEQMNKTKEQVETLEKNAKSLNDFLKVYHNYNEIVLLTKARNYIEVSAEHKKTSSKLSDLIKEIKSLKDSHTKKSERYANVLDEIKVETENKRHLDNRDLKNKIESLEDIKGKIKILEIKLEELSRSIEKTEEERIESSNKMKTYENDIYKIQREIEKTVFSLKDYKDDSYFDEIVFFGDELLEKIDEQVPFDSIYMSLKRYTDKINALIDLLQEEQTTIQESETTRVEFEKLSKEYKDLERQRSTKETEYKETIMKWEEDFVNLINNTQKLKIEDQVKKHIFGLMNDYSKKNYDLSTSIYIDSARSQINVVTSDKLKLENKKSTKEIELSKLKIEYENIKNATDYELPTLNESTDKLLQESGIENISLYKCIEFKLSIDDRTKSNLESNLLDLNILNAKIIAPEDLEKVKKLNTEILYLTKTTKKKNNILKFVDVKLSEETKIKKEYVEEILECISIDSSDALSIQENGLSKIDVLNSIADKNYKQAYIGFLKRMELKKSKLKSIADEIELTNKEISNIDMLIKEKEKDEEILTDEMAKFPKADIIENIVEDMKIIDLKLEYNDSRQKDIEAKLSLYNKKIKEIKDTINEKRSGIYAPLNLITLKNVRQMINAIKDTLADLKTEHLQYLSKLELKTNINEKLASIDNTLDYLRLEENEKETELKVNMAAKNSIEEILNTKEYADLKDKLLTIENRLTSLHKEKETLIGETATLSNEISNKESSLKNVEEDERVKEKLESAYKEILLKEYNLNYIYQEPIEDLEKTAKKIVSDGTARKNANFVEILNDFLSSFNKYSLELNEYSLKNVTIINEYTGEDEDLKKIYNENARQDVTSMYQGVKMNIIKLTGLLKDAIEENRLLISTQDRVLFEDILLNTVGEKIRNRIRSSNEWVKKINSIMTEMQKDSALSFRLVWKSVSAENEGEVDTKEIVRILEMPPDALKDKDKENLTEHFRCKIKRAEQLNEDSYISFYKIIEEVLDYRTWFTFQLFYQRKGTNPKELTDKTFSKFSGGERAKSMYIPLFASCYAKLNLAKEDSLRVIALDEAFAGVDEDNIREMFGILKYLDLNFIINSQVLWGDYDTIEDLSICELIRPQNSQVVTVERYRWNGKYKKLITDRKEYNEGN